MSKRAFLDFPYPSIPEFNPTSLAVPVYPVHRIGLLYIIEIDIPNRTINVKISDEELASRLMQPLKRNRVVSKSLKAYAQSVSSADKGGVRII